jgi:hypothetical protein
LCDFISCDDIFMLFCSLMFSHAKLPAILAAALNLKVPARWNTSLYLMCTTITKSIPKWLCFRYRNTNIYTDCISFTHVTYSTVWTLTVFSLSKQLYSVICCPFRVRTISFVFCLFFYHPIVIFKSVTIEGKWIGRWIYWQLAYTTRNYNLQITDTHTDYYPQSITVSTSCFLATASTEGDPSSSRAQVLLS